MNCENSPDITSMRLHFGKWLKSNRIAAGLTQDKLSSLIEITATQLARIERGTSGTRTKTALKIANIFKIDPQILFKEMGMLYEQPESGICKKNTTTYESRIPLFRNSSAILRAVGISAHQVGLIQWLTNVQDFIEIDLSEETCRAMIRDRQAKQNIEVE